MLDGTKSQTRPSGVVGRPRCSRAADAGQPTLRRRLLGPLFFTTVVTCGATDMRADTWALPEPVRAIESANRQYLLHLVAGGQRTVRPRCEGIIFERGTNSPDRELARFEMENRRSPVDAYISDDGQHVVALDDWGSVGLGDHVVAFYNRRGLVKKYSLEEMLAGVGGLPNDPEQIRLWNRFRHSVSSRHWRDTEMVFLEGHADQARFAIWLSWAREWLVWRGHDGVSVRTNPDEVRPWEDYGRRWALARLEAPPVPEPAPDIPRGWNEAAIAWSSRKSKRYQGRIQACRYLATLRRAADRPLLEALLQDPEEDGNSVPLLRIQADIALAFWDGLTPEVRAPGIQELRSLEARLYRLGHLRVNVEQPLPVSKAQGHVYFSLLPETVTESDWRTSPPTLRTGAGFTGSEHQQGQTHPPLHFPGTPPGRYWIKAFWKLTPPFDEELRLPADSRGPATSGTSVSESAASPDYFESKGREVFEVRPGEISTVTIAFQQGSQNRQ
jgi:hypothetical protein